MRPATVVVVKLRTDDGLCEFMDHVQIGTRYRVDLDRIERGVWMTHIGDNGSRTVHRKDIVYSLEGNRGWLPFECVRVEGGR